MLGVPVGAGVTVLLGTGVELGSDVNVGVGLGARVGVVVGTGAVMQPLKSIILTRTNASDTMPARFNLPLPFPESVVKMPKQAKSLLP